VEAAIDAKVENVETWLLKFVPDEEEAAMQFEDVLRMFADVNKMSFLADNVQESTKARFLSVVTTIETLLSAQLKIFTEGANRLVALSIAAAGVIVGYELMCHRDNTREDGCASPRTQTLDDTGTSGDEFMSAASDVESVYDDAPEGREREVGSFAYGRFSKAFLDNVGDTKRAVQANLQNLFDSSKSGSQTAEDSVNTLLADQGDDDAAYVSLKTDCTNKLVAVIHYFSQLAELRDCEVAQASESGRSTFVQTYLINGPKEYLDCLNADEGGKLGIIHQLLAAELALDASVDPAAVDRHSLESRLFVASELCEGSHGKTYSVTKWPAEFSVLSAKIQGCIKILAAGLESEIKAAIQTWDMKELEDLQKRYRERDEGGAVEFERVVADKLETLIDRLQVNLSKDSEKLQHVDNSIWEETVKSRIGEVLEFSTRLEILSNSSEAKEKLGNMLSAIKNALIEQLSAQFAKVRTAASVLEDVPNVVKQVHVIETLFKRLDVKGAPSTSAFVVEQKECNKMVSNTIKDAVTKYNKCAIQLIATSGTLSSSDPYFGAEDGAFVLSKTQLAESSNALTERDEPSSVEQIEIVIKKKSKKATPGPGFTFDTTTHAVGQVHTVNAVDEASVADRAGLLVGDVIVRLDTTDITHDGFDESDVTEATHLDFEEALQSGSKKKTVTLTVERKPVPKIADTEITVLYVKASAGISLSLEKVD
jgi:hypothetical protein